MGFLKTDLPRSPPSRTKMTSVRVCFLLDCTGSMEPWITAAKRKVVEIADKIVAQHPDTDVKMGLIGYRDYDDRRRFEKTNFTTPDLIAAALTHIEAFGGDDTAEDVAGGITHATNLCWGSADVSMIVHIADAPAHGWWFHEPNISDRYPGGDPAGWDLEGVFESMAEDGIEYTFVRITSATDMMTEVCRKAYGDDSRFHVVDLHTQPCETAGDPEEMFSEAVSRAVNTSIERYTASQSQ